MKRVIILIIVASIITLGIIYTVRRSEFDGKFTVNNKAYYYIFEKIERDKNISSPFGETTHKLHIYNNLLIKVTERDLSYYRDFELIKLESIPVYSDQTKEDKNINDNKKKLYGLYMTSIKDDFNDLRYTREFLGIVFENSKIIKEISSIGPSELDFMNNSFHINITNNSNDFEDDIKLLENNFIINDKLHQVQIESSSNNKINYSYVEVYNNVKNYSGTFEIDKDKIVTFKYPIFNTNHIEINKNKCISTYINYYLYDSESNIVQFIEHNDKNTLCIIDNAYEIMELNQININVLEEFTLEVLDKY